MIGTIKKSIFICFFMLGILFYLTGTGFAISDSNKSIQLSVFSLGANGEVTSDPNEVIEGSESFKGHYSGNDSWNEYLYSIPERLPLSPHTKYRVTFDYKILETPDRGFETIFYSPIGGSQNDWLPGQVFTGNQGDSGRITLTNTLANYDDYQIRWNIIGSGAISVDNIEITNLDNGSVAEIIINIPVYSITDKISNRPTVPVFYPWSGPCDQSLWFDCDTNASPYSLIWTSAGQSLDLESTQPSVTDEQNIRMRSDNNTLYLIYEEWLYYNPKWRNLSSDSKFYLNEFFKFHESSEGSEYDRAFMINFTDPEWADVLAEKASNFKAAGFDGLMFDWWNNWGGSGNGRSEALVESTRLSILKKIRQEVGPDFVLMGNTNWNVNDPTAQYLSGVFLELWRPDPAVGYVPYIRDENNPSQPFSIERMEKVLKYWDANLAIPRIIAFEACKITQNDYIADRYTQENYDLAKLFTAMALVIPENGYMLYADNNVDWSGGDHQHAYYDFYFTDFGKATSGTIEVIEGVAYKQYEKGIIAYNRTQSKVNLEFSGGNSIAINPMEGLFYAIDTVENGDVNDDGVVNWLDAYLTLQLSTQQTPDDDLFKDADVNQDEKIGLVEAIYALQAADQQRMLLSVTPLTQDVDSGSGTTTFDITNTGAGTMTWSAFVTSGSDWLSISSGSSGVDSGTISCQYTANSGTVERTATIRVTADGAGGSPVDVTVNQSAPIPFFTVTFLDHDGTELKSESVLQGSGATAPEAPTREGYTFAGWDKAFVNITGDLTVTALYEYQPGECGAYVAPDVWKEFDCYNLAAIGKLDGDDPFIPSWKLIGGYWQWGRKGPDSSQWHNTNTEHFAHGPTGPGVGEANDGKITGWDSSSGPDGAWSDSHKTANDPCPTGYRVPTKAQWDGVQNNNNQSMVGTTWSNSSTNYTSARKFGDDLMLPAAGGRGYGSAALGGRGSSGDYWSSSESSSSCAWRLYFNSGAVGTSQGGYRQYGFSVRCISE